MKSRLSILGLYNYDNTIFDNLLLPTGIVKEDVVNNLLLELSELEVLYPNFDVMKAAIGFWSKKELPVWTKMYNTTVFVYDPLTNLKRDETHTTTEIRDLTESGSHYSDSSNTTTDNNTHHSETGGTTTNNGTDTQKEYNSGFNSDTPALAKQTEQIMGSGNTVSGSVDGTDNTTNVVTGGVDSVENTTNTGTVTTDYRVHAEGSIGVITNQQFIEQERKVAEFNIINYIIDSFKSRFCILVY